MIDVKEAHKLLSDAVATKPKGFKYTDDPQNAKLKLDLGACVNYDPETQEASCLLGVVLIDGLGSDVENFKPREDVETSVKMLGIDITPNALAGWAAAQSAQDNGLSWKDALYVATRVWYVLEPGWNSI